MTQLISSHQIKCVGNFPLMLLSFPPKLEGAESNHGPSFSGILIGHLSFQGRFYFIMITCITCSSSDFLEGRLLILFFFYLFVFFGDNYVICCLFCEIEHWKHKIIFFKNFFDESNKIANMYFLSILWLDYSRIVLFLIHLLFCLRSKSWWYNKNIHTYK